jgi:hypothetical protein
MRGRVVVAAGIAVAVFGMSVGTAAAAQWKKNPSGLAEVCFTGEGFDAVAEEQAGIAAAQWNAVSTNLNVTYGDCVPGANEVPMSVGLRIGANQFGETTWTEINGEFVGAEIKYDEEGIASWASKVDNVVDGDTLQLAWLQLFCHEMGHALGLPHVTAADSCMQTEVSTPFTKPGAGDISLLRQFYGGSAKPASDGTTTTVPVTIPATTTPDTTVPEDAGDTGEDGDAGEDPSTTTIPEDGDDTSGSPIMTIPIIPVGQATSVTTTPEDDGDTGVDPDGDGSGTDPEDDSTTTTTTIVPEAGEDEESTTTSTSTTLKSTSTSVKGGKEHKDGKGHKDGKTGTGKGGQKDGKSTDGKRGKSGTKHSCKDRGMSREQATKMIKAMKVHYKEHKQERKAYQAGWSNRR